jgi:hypothetical protein
MQNPYFYVFAGTVDRPGSRCDYRSRPAALWVHRWKPAAHGRLAAFALNVQKGAHASNSTGTILRDRNSQKELAGRIVCLKTTSYS